jgi:hypothetical protein
MQLPEGSKPMRLKRFIGAAVVAVLVLAMASIAVATGSKKAAAKTEPAAAEFTAAPVADKTKTRTCTGVDGQYNITHGTYKGTSTGDPRLTGDIVIRTKSIVNLDNGLGVTQGTVWLSKPAATTPKSHGKKHRYQAVAKLQAVNTERGKLDGFLSGHAKNADGKGTVALAANFSATFNADGTSLTGQLGGDAPVAPTNSAVFYGRPCAPEPKNTQQGDDDRGGRGHGDDDDRHDGRHNDGKNDDDKRG